MPADIFLLAGLVWCCIDRADLNEEQRAAVAAVLAAGRGDGPQATPEQCATVRAFANEYVEGGFDAEAEAADMPRHCRP